MNDMDELRYRLQDVGLCEHDVNAVMEVVESDPPPSRDIMRENNDDIVGGKNTKFVPAKVSLPRPFPRHPPRRTGSLLQSAIAYWEAYIKVKKEVIQNEMSVIEELLTKRIKAVDSLWNKNLYKDIKSRIVWKTFTNDSDKHTMVCNICLKPYSVIITSDTVSYAGQELTKELRNELQRVVFNDVIKKAHSYEIHSNVILIRTLKDIRKEALVLAHSPDIQKDECDETDS